jgi:CRP/FNR family transcriptional regulator
VATSRGPSIRAIPSLSFSGVGLVELLSDSQREMLRSMATMQQFTRRSVIFKAGAPADAIFIIAEGVVKSYRDLPSGRRRIAAFLFARDMCGLAKGGQYVNTAQAITPVSVYRLNVSTLAEAFRRDSELELRFLCKVVHELREAQHHTIIVTHRRATARVAMLLHMLERGAEQTGDAGVPIPMTRSDIADYLGLSLEAVVRASRRLERQGILAFPDRHHAKVLDRQRFDALIHSS